MPRNNPSLEELTAIVESIVAQAMNKSFGSVATWAENRARPDLYLTYGKDRQGSEDNARQLLDGMRQVTKLVEGFDELALKDKKKFYFGTSAENAQIDSLEKNIKGLEGFGKKLGGLAGIYDAYQSGDALSGAMSGFSAFGPWGAAAGLLAGLLSPGIDRWQRPKFKDAKQAVDKLFMEDRGERDEYYLPDSFYFRQGQNIPRNIVIRINDQKFDDHVRESLTNNYASQLQRGLVF